jgi:hypothetical protein
MVVYKIQIELQLPLTPPTNSLGPSPQSYLSSAILDTGATSHFLSINAPYSNKRPASPALHVSLADHSIMVSSHQVNLNLPSLPTSACTALLFPALGVASLLSIGQFCDAECMATFTASLVQVCLHNKLLIKGSRSPSTNFLWRVNLPIMLSPPPQALSMMQGTPSQLVAFTHAALFSPSHSTLRWALQQNFLVTIPGLTPKLLAKYPPNLIATDKVISTKPKKIFNPLSPNHLLPLHPPSPPQTSLYRPTRLTTTHFLPVPPLACRPTTALPLSWRPLAKSSPTKPAVSFSPPAKATHSF